MPDTVQNSESILETQVSHTPESVCADLAIPQSSYYEWMKFLGETTKKENGKAYLTDCQVDRLRELKMWRDQHGKLKGFLEAEQDDAAAGDEVGQLAVAGGGQLGDVRDVVEAETRFVEDHGDGIFDQAARLAAHRLITVPAMVVDELARNLTAADIPADIAADAQQTAQQVINPLELSPQSIAARLLEQHRQAAKPTARSSAIA